MRKLIASTMMTLDGVLENPQNWSFDHWNDEIQDYAHTQLFTSDTLIMGHTTYVSFAEAWSARAGADEFADRMNSLPKYVASRTATSPLEWNAKLMKEDAVVPTITKLKQEDGQDILQYGMGELTYTLIEHGLVDEVRFVVFPVAVGNGERIFEGMEKLSLKLIDTKTFLTGVMILHYQPVNNA